MAVLAISLAALTTTQQQGQQLARRQLCLSAIPGLAAVLCSGPSAARAAGDLHDRDRGTNGNAIVQKDWYYENGLVPPQKLRLDALPADQPKYSAWSSCVDKSCSYVPIERRYKGYKKYAPDVIAGSSAFARLRGPIASGDWAAVSAAVARGDAAAKRPTGPVTVALVRAVLLGNALLISENNANDISDALLARFYVNEAGFAADELRAAAEGADKGRAAAALELGLDSWASYFTMVNRAVVPKVGETLALPSP